MLFVITGPMFAGKTTELIRRVNRARRAKQAVQIFVPVLDTRKDGRVVTHDDQELLTGVQRVAEAVNVLHLIDHNTRLVAVDEAHLFDKQLPSVCRLLRDRHISVIVAGLDRDFNGDPFGSMPTLLALADDVVKLTAVCMQCGRDDARYSFRLVNDQAQVLIGGSEFYEARCFLCWKEDAKPLFNEGAKIS